MHTFREGNACTDVLSKKGTQCGPGIMILRDCPAWLIPYVARDLSGVTVPREF